MFDKPYSLFQQQVAEITKKNKAEDVLTDLIRLQLFKNAEKNESLLVLVDVYNYLGPEKFMGTLNILEGKSLNFPKKESFIETIQIAICYYFRKIKNKTWEETKQLLNDEDLEAIKLGIKVRQLQTFIDKMSEMAANRNKNLARQLVEEAIHE